jgi:hypothetical protein
MKNKMRMLAIIASFGGLVTAAFAGSWYHATADLGNGANRPAMFNQDVVVPAPAYVEQKSHAYGSGVPTTILINSGPLGYFSDYPGPNFLRSGNVGAGTYTIQHVVLASGGLVSTSITW